MPSKRPQGGRGRACQPILVSHRLGRVSFYLLAALFFLGRDPLPADLPGQSASPGAPNPSLTPIANPATVGADYSSSPNTNPPAVMALPVNNGPLPTDSSTTRKFYTISASLREIYDDNVNTTSVNPQSSFETELSPSLLVDFPSQGNDFSARYTFDATYYSNYATGSSANVGGTGSNNNSGSSIQYSHEFVAQYQHSFSDRFSLNASELFRYYVEPSLFESTGTNYQNGPYVTNILNGNLTAQWTPLFGTTTTYANTIVHYDESSVATNQDSVENTGSQTFSFAILPKISLNFGGIGDNITYDETQRGYTSYTAFVGAAWQALPSISVSGRGGGSYTEQNEGPDSLSPYGALSFSWSLGARSTLSFDYAHEVTPTDQVNANEQTSDRISANFSYQITPRLSAHLQGIYTKADTSESLINQPGATANNNYTENDYALDTGLNYQFDKYIGVDGGVTLSGVSSNSTFNNNYSRDETYVGIRGTY